MFKKNFWSFILALLIIKYANKLCMVILNVEWTWLRIRQINVKLMLEQNVDSEQILNRCWIVNKWNESIACLSNRKFSLSVNEFRNILISIQMWLFCSRVFTCAILTDLSAYYINVYLCPASDYALLCHYNPTCHRLEYCNFILCYFPHPISDSLQYVPCFVRLFSISRGISSQCWCPFQHESWLKLTFY